MNGNPLVIMIGAQGSGKSTLVAKLFSAECRFSLDGFRRQLAGDVAALDATAEAVKMLHLVVDYRMRKGLLTVVDATNTKLHHRDELRNRARYFQRPAVAVLMHTPLEVCLARQKTRTAPYPQANDQPVPDNHVIRDWTAIATDPPWADEYDVVLHVHPTNTDILIGETRHDEQQARGILAAFAPGAAMVGKDEPLPWSARI